MDNRTDDKILKEILAFLEKYRKDPWITNGLSEVLRDALIRGDVKVGKTTIDRAGVGDAAAVALPGADKIIENLEQHYIKVFEGSQQAARERIDFVQQLLADSHPDEFEHILSANFENSRKILEDFVNATLSNEGISIEITDEIIEAMSKGKDNLFATINEKLFQA